MNTPDWRPVISYGGRFTNYSASSLGEIRNNRTGKVLKPGLAGRDRRYYYVRLWADGTGRTSPVAMLVAEAFFGLKAPGLSTQINHKDGVRTNNAVDNLEFVSSKENGEHAAEHALKAWGEGHGLHKLTADQVRAIRVDDTWSLRKMAKKYGTSNSNILSIRNRKTWRHLP